MINLIPSENGDAVLVADLHGHQERHGLDRVVPAVDVVSHEEVVGVWRVAPNPEELLQIMKLPMDVTTHSHGALDTLHIRLGLQNLLGLIFSETSQKKFKEKKKEKKKKKRKRK